AGGQAVRELGPHLGLRDLDRGHRRRSDRHRGSSFESGAGRDSGAATMLAAVSRSRAAPASGSATRRRSVTVRVRVRAIRSAMMPAVWIMWVVVIPAHRPLVAPG